MFVKSLIGNEDILASLLGIPSGFIRRPKVTRKVTTRIVVVGGIPMVKSKKTVKKEAKPKKAEKIVKPVKAKAPEAPFISPIPEELEYGLGSLGLVVSAISRERGPRFFYFGRRDRKNGGVVTCAVITAKDFKDRPVLVTGYAFCSPKDSFSRPCGRKQAVQRMVDNPIIIRANPKDKASLRIAKFLTYASNAKNSESYRRRGFPRWFRGSEVTN